MGMAAKKLTPEEEAEQDDSQMVQFNVRVPRGLLREMDAWLDADNATRRFRKRTRSDLVRDGLIWLVEHRPDLGGK